MDASMMKRMKELEDENRRLKKMYAEERLKAEIIQEALEKSGDAISTQGDGEARGVSKRNSGTYGLPDIQRQRDVLSLSAKAFQ